VILATARFRRFVFLKTTQMLVSTATTEIPGFPDTPHTSGFFRTSCIQSILRAIDRTGKSVTTELLQPAVCNIQNRNIRLVTLGPFVPAVTAAAVAPIQTFLAQPVAYGEASSFSP
jgi:hypothetical protein